MTFSSCHPAAAAIYFLSILLIAMFSVHPILLAAAFFGGILYLIRVDRSAMDLRTQGFFLLFFLLVTLVNPLVSHNGVTALFFLNGNAVTLEAVLYGMDLALMLIDVMCWFRCFNKVMTSDRLVFLVGRAAPKTALLLSASLRFIPMLREQAGKLMKAQKTTGAAGSELFTDRIRGMMRIFSALVTWGLEKAVEMGASMKARGYGLKGRTSFELYPFRRSDGVLLTVILALDAVVLAAMFSGKLKFTFYPQIITGETGILGKTACGAFILLSFLPVILDVTEEIQWKLSRSAI